MKLIATLLILISAISVNAQIEKGKILLGGEMYYQSHKNNFAMQKYKSGGLDLSIGKAIKTNTILGISLQYAGYRYVNSFAPDTSTYSYNTYRAGLFYRKYKHLAKGFYMLGEGNALFETGNSHSLYSVPSGALYGKSIGGIAGITAGMAYKFCKKWQLEITLPNLVSLHYTHNRLHNNNSPNIIYTENDFSAHSSLSGSTLSSLGIGFRLVL